MKQTVNKKEKIKILTITNSTSTRQAVIRPERLHLQAKIFQASSENFLKKTKISLQNMNCLPKKILDIGCANGEETQILSYYFPYAEIVSIDTNPKYIIQAKRTTHLSNVFFHAVKSYTPETLINKFGYPDLIYWRMHLIHKKKPKSYLKNLLNVLNGKTFFAIEEPDVSNYKSIPHDKWFNYFTNLCIKYDKIRGEDYNFGKKLTKLLNELGRNIYYHTEKQIILRTIGQKQLIKFLVEDLIPIFYREQIDTKENLSFMKNYISKKLVYNPNVKFNYYAQTQVLFN